MDPKVKDVVATSIEEMKATAVSVAKTTVYNILTEIKNCNYSIAKSRARIAELKADLSAVKIEEMDFGDLD